MTTLRGYRYRLYPTPDQEVMLTQFIGVVRFVYNLALEQRERMWTYYRDNGTPLTRFQQGRELTQLRAEVDWIAAVPRTCLDYALLDLDTAYTRFYRGVSRHPNYRRKDQGHGVKFAGHTCSASRSSDKWGVIRLPKAGAVRFRMTRAWGERIVSVAVTRDAIGWHVALQAEAPVRSTPQASTAVGIDRGIANTLALSTGELLSLPETSSLERRRKMAQRVLARRVKGSARREAAKQRAHRITAKIARIRLDWQHKMSRRIADRFGIVAIEKLRVADMTARGRGKRGLNRSIRHQAWGIFERLLAYKLDERGGTLVRVSPTHTSQTCSCCGTIDKASRKSQAEFACQHCGFTAHADINAATNILRRHTASMCIEEGQDYRPSGEVRTMQAIGCGLSDLAEKMPLRASLQDKGGTA